MSVRAWQEENRVAEILGGNLLRASADVPDGITLPPATTYGGFASDGLALTFVSNDPIPPFPADFAEKTYHEAHSEGWLRPGVFTKARTEGGKLYLMVVEIKAAT